MRYVALVPSYGLFVRKSHHEFVHSRIISFLFFSILISFLFVAFLFFFSFIIEFGKSKVKSSYLGFRFETDVTFVPKRKFGFLPILSTKEDEWKKTFGFNLRRFKYVRVAIEKLYL